MTTKRNASEINISVNGIWAGGGTIQDGVIADCDAILGGSQDNADRIYDGIECAIANGDTGLTDGGDTYTWTIG